MSKGIELINAFEEWTREDEMKGSAPPDEWDEIKDGFDMAKTQLISYVEQLEQGFNVKTENRTKTETRTLYELAKDIDLKVDQLLAWHKIAKASGE